ncbi:hypothetical protein IQ277_31590 [Nostocales cyanobacterium LEGE 12452]|nr:hypothetical protein [Nostocales cyanobacterium LEGE 12452]
MTQRLGRFHLSFERSLSQLWVEKQNFSLEKNRSDRFYSWLQSNQAV